MGLQRTPHWARRELHAFLLARADEPFAWGKNDCCLFPADAILAMTGVDLAKDFRDKYSDAAGAMRLIAGVTGGKSVGDAAAWCAAQQGLVELEHPRCAQRGDLVTMLNGDGDEMAGIVGLSGRHLVTVGQPGLVTFSIEKVKRAWRV